MIAPSNSVTGRARPRFGLGSRLFVAQAAVFLTAALTTLTVAALVGPPLFHYHLAVAGDTLPPSVIAHADQAFATAAILSTAVGTLIALAGALAVTSYVGHRINRAVASLARTSSEVAAGGYGHNVQPPGLGPELDELAAALNTLAGQLRSIEDTRRRLLTDLAHELRTPIASLDVCLDGLEDGVLDASPETFATLREQTRRLARLATDLRDVAAAEEGGVKLVLAEQNVAELLQAAASAARGAYQAKGVQLDVDPGSAGLSTVRVDPARIQQVLSNLLTNALRHTPTGGHVELVGDTTRDSVTLVVSDTGEGIPAEHLPHVFERFYRADGARDRAHGGTGVGLAIAKALVEAHHGTIAAASPGTGHGATFTVRLPLADRRRTT